MGKTLSRTTLEKNSKVLHAPGAESRCRDKNACMSCTRTEEIHTHDKGTSFHLLLVIKWAKNWRILLTVPVVLALF